MLANGNAAPLIAGLAVGISFIFLLSMAMGRILPAAGAQEEITGKVVCLPHKQGLFGGVTTAECRIGFLDEDSGKYYGLILDKEHRWLYAAERSDESFIVNGTVRKPLETDGLERYDTAGGVIDNVTSVSTLDGSTSIYEVKHRYPMPGQLIDILEEIQAATGGGYSMGIEECNGEPCIRITLEKDAPAELTDELPREIKGYKVDVQILN